MEAVALEPKLLGRPPKRHATDRRCSEEGCPTMLSSYNPGGRCWAHSEPRYLFGGPRKRRSRG